VFGSAREHPIRLVGPFRHQVVYEDARVRLVSLEHERLPPIQLQTRVDPRDDSLGGSLLVSGRPIDLPGQVQPADVPHLEGRSERARVHEVVLHRVPRLDEDSSAEPADAPHHVDLHVERETR
jgi:hypothetical protein